MPHSLGVDEDQSGLFQISSSPIPTIFCTFFGNPIRSTSTLTMTRTPNGITLGAQNSQTRHLITHGFFHLGELHGATPPSRARPDPQLRVAPPSCPRSYRVPSGGAFTGMRAPPPAVVAFASPVARHRASATPGFLAVPAPRLCWRVRRGTPHCLRRAPGGWRDMRDPVGALDDQLLDARRHGRRLGRRGGEPWLGRPVELGRRGHQSHGHRRGRGLASLPALRRAARRARGRGGRGEGRVRGRRGLGRRPLVPAGGGGGGRDLGADAEREVEERAGAAHAVGGAVVGERGVLGGVVGAEPHARAVLGRVPDLRRELAPRPLPHAPVVLAPRHARRGPFRLGRRGAAARRHRLRVRVREAEAVVGVGVGVGVRGRERLGLDPREGAVGEPAVGEGVPQRPEHDHVVGVVGAERQRAAPLVRHEAPEALAPPVRGPRLRRLLQEVLPDGVQQHRALLIRHWRRGLSVWFMS
ncbi:hypothetical protein GQ55_7G234100 [Panicum hallii var. hallii]|uniref:Uncharacterized protein n=1 Tax=Panicum hallii var. hallii TaxID=1504633 RepID=A0A2T7CYH5_9POAL|nr:hypothetical protein GQ55_7G234100 [Panicum hallii var. hallii]